jgi:hypothetical protein
MDFYFLLFSLFCPRIVLLAFVLFFVDRFPANTIPMWGDILLGTLFPRILILIYIYQNMGYDNVWFIAHLAVAVLAYMGGGRSSRKRYRRRRGD